MISPEEMDVLRELASKVAKTATGKEMKQSRFLWKRHNKLRQVSCSPWVEITKGCRVELIMKDNHTIGNRPENVVDWCRIAREEVEIEERR